MEFTSSKQYEILGNPIGMGGFGRVFRIRSKNDGKMYALKTVDLESLKSQGAGADELEGLETMAKREGEIMKMAQPHEHIVKVFGWFTENTTYHIVMELFERGTLKQAIRDQNGQMFPEAKITKWAAQLAITLMFLHNKNILHGGVKAEDVLINEKDELKYCDFGIARLSHEDDLCRIPVGTVTHMAPEQLGEEEPYHTKKAEVWAFGVVLYELTQLQLPFSPSNNINTVMKSICHKPIPPITAAVSPELRSLIETKLLDRNPASRPSMDQVVCHPCILNALTATQRSAATEPLSTSVLVTPQRAVKPSEDVKGHRNVSGSVMEFNSSEQFNILREVGAGGFAKVFNVKAKTDGKEYAMKKVNLEGKNFHDEGSRQKMIKMALAEGERMASFRHKHIVKVSSWFLEDPNFYVIMEWCSKGTLKDKINSQAQTGQAFPEMKILDWATQLAVTLKYLHKNNILHRDVKTENIFFSESDQLKLGDFGISKPITKGAGTTTNDIIGTATHHAPEMLEAFIAQLNSLEDDDKNDALFMSTQYTPAAEVWAYGVTLFEITALKLPFEYCDVFREMCRRICKKPIPAISTNISPELNSFICEEILKRDPTSRPTMEQVIAAIVSQQVNFGHEPTASASQI